MFHPDVEAQGIPAEAEDFRDAVRGADAIIIACPEYNGSMTATLKNAIEVALPTRQPSHWQNLLHHRHRTRSLRLPPNAHARLMQHRV